MQIATLASNFTLHGLNFTCAVVDKEMFYGNYGTEGTEETPVLIIKFYTGQPCCPKEGNEDLIRSRTDSITCALDDALDGYACMYSSNGWHDGFDDAAAVSATFAIYEDLHTDEDVIEVVRRFILAQ
jgi:hypothetical protein